MSDQSANSKQRLEELERRCAQYESWLRAIDEHANFDVWFKDAESRYRFVNRSFEAAMGRPRTELLDRPPVDVFDHERAQRAFALDRKIMEDGVLERVVPCDENGCLEMHQEIRFPVHDRDGDAVGLGCFAFEVTQRSLAEQALAQAQEIAHLGNWRWSISEGCLVSCSEEFARLLGCTVKEAFELMPKRVEQLVHPDDRDTVRRIMTRPQADCASYEISYRIIRADGEVRHMSEIAHPLLGNDGLPVEYVGTLQDVTEFKTIEQDLRDAKVHLERRVRERTEHLEHIATHDGLTGLLNRGAFYDLAEKRLRSPETGSQPRSGLQGSLKGLQSAVILLDLDGFKAVNDSFGHAAGDDVLRAIGQRIRETVKSTDLVARLGGDEFAIAVFGLPEGERTVSIICDRLHRRLSRPIQSGGLQAVVECSIGVALLEPAVDGVEDAIKSADLALRKAKRTEEGLLFFEQRMADEVAHRRTLEADFRVALEGDEITVAFQPQVEAKTGKLRGVEALARWDHPRFGAVSPAEFVSIAEECGLIHSFGRYIFERSCTDFQRLETHYGREITLAVNLSGAQFYDDGLVDGIRACLDRTGIDPRRIEIEITESVLIRHLARSREMLQEMRRMGIRIALDDFGTGYSALRYLQLFDIDTIKLDRLFTSTFEAKDDPRLLEGITKLANGLDLDVIAEGVETEAQAGRLASFGCDYLQGFHFGRPVSVQDWLQNEHGGAVIA